MRSRQHQQWQWQQKVAANIATNYAISSAPLGQLGRTLNLLRHFKATLGPKTLGKIGEQKIVSAMNKIVVRPKKNE